MKRTFVLITTVFAAILIGNKCLAQGDELVRVYRWYNPEGQLSAEEIVKESLNIAADICIYTNHNLVIEKIS